jgi:hypothetical protein
VCNCLEGKRRSTWLESVRKVSSETAVPAGGVLCCALNAVRGQLSIHLISRGSGRRMSLFKDLKTSSVVVSRAKEALETGRGQYCMYCTWVILYSTFRSTSGTERRWSVCSFGSGDENCRNGFRRFQAPLDQLTGKGRPGAW